MINAKGLSKSFGPIKAVDNITFSVERGEVLGFLGPNGAGKSTTMKILTCFITPTAGEAYVGGNSILEDTMAVRKMIGYMPENAPLYGDMAVLEFLEYMARIREMPKSEIRDAIKRVVKMCALQDVMHQSIDTLSKGFKRRVSLAQSLLHDPEILILDEPTDGLDPIQKFEVRGLIRELAKNKCIILSTHILEEVEAVCSRAIIISKGQIVYDGTPEDLKGRSETGRIDDVFRALATKEKIEGVRV